MKCAKCGHARERHYSNTHGIGTHCEVRGCGCGAFRTPESNR